MSSERGDAMGEEKTVEEQLADAKAEVDRLTKDNKAQKDKQKVLNDELIELGRDGPQATENLAIRLRDAEARIETLLAKNTELKARISELEGT
jgi:hypothetical protein